MSAGIGQAGCDHEHDLLFRCPQCEGPACGSCGLCAGCGWAAPIDDRVIQLLAGEDSFYEGTYAAQIHIDERQLQRWRGRAVLPFVNYGYLKLILDTVERGSRVLELGCGGGMQLAGQRYEVTAVDLSASSLKGTPSTYRHRLQADVLDTDFLSGRFDAVCSSCFFEHFTPEQKGDLLERIHRWLRPGGLLIFLFDTESLSPFFQWLRKSPDLYHQCFVEHDGHVGLEPASVNKRLFAEKGFSPLHGVGLNRTLQHLPVFGWVEPYGSRFRWLGRLSRLGKAVRKRPALMHLYTAGLHVWDISMGPLFPEDWSRLYLGSWERV